MEDDWTKDNPSYGQCYSTTLLVNDYFGGKILKAKFEDGTGHYWNLIDNKEIDLTREQFDKDEIIPKPSVHSREELLNKPSYKEYNRRYHILKHRVEDFLKQNK